MELNLEQCPLCGTELSRIKSKEIQTRLQEEERKNTARLAQAETATRQRLEQQYKVDLEKQKQAAERKARTESEVEVKKIAAERDLAAGKLKQAEVREVDAVCGSGQPEVGDVVVHGRAKRIGQIIVCPERVALLRGGERGRCGIVAVQNLLFVNDRERRPSRHDSENAVRI